MGVGPEYDQDEQIKWNKEMKLRWMMARINWRDLEWVEEFEVEECNGQVYSPKGGTNEEKEKLKERAEIRKTRQLESAWEKFHSARSGLRECQAGWKDRNTKEMRHIRVLEAKERLKRKLEAERRYGKKIVRRNRVQKKDDELAWETKMKLWLSEANTNLEERNKIETKKKNNDKKDLSEKRRVRRTNRKTCSVPRSCGMS